MFLVADPTKTYYFDGSWYRIISINNNNRITRAKVSVECTNPREIPADSPIIPNTREDIPISQYIIEANISKTKKKMNKIDHIIVTTRKKGTKKRKIKKDDMLMIKSSWWNYTNEDGELMEYSKLPNVKASYDIRVVGLYEETLGSLSRKWLDFRIVSKTKDDMREWKNELYSFPLHDLDYFHDFIKFPTKRTTKKAVKPTTNATKPKRTRKTRKRKRQSKQSVQQSTPDADSLVTPKKAKVSSNINTPQKIRSMPTFI